MRSKLIKQKWISFGKNLSKALLALAGIVLLQLSGQAQITKLRDLVGTGTNGRLADDNFGSAVAVYGDVMVVGAPYQAYDSAGGNSLSNAGAAYVFHKNQGGTNNWGLVKKLTGKGTNGRRANDFFGLSVAIYDDVIVVGSYNNRDSAGGNAVTEAGSAYIFHRNSGGTNNWGFVKKITGKGTNGRGVEDWFGFSLSIDNDIIVAGAQKQDYDSAGGNFEEDAGAAFIFYRNSGGTDNWGFVKKITGKGTKGRGWNDAFGITVAISGEDIVVTAPGHSFDSIGGDSIYGAGAAFVFNKNSGGADNWGMVKKLTGKGTNGRRPGSNYGFGVTAASISDDVIAIGANTHTYDSIGGDSIVQAGAVFVYQKNSGGTNNWGMVKILNGKGTNGRLASDNFGSTVKVDQNLIAVGAINQNYDSAGANFVAFAGAIYIFNRNSGGTDNWGFVKKLSASGTNGRITGDQFGYSLSMSGDVVVTGTPSQSYDTAGGNQLDFAGKATIFSSSLEFDLEYTGTTWVPHSPNSTTSGIDISIGSGSPTFDAGAEGKDLTIASGATPSIGSGTFTVNGSYTNNGATSGSGSITLGGSAHQTIYGSGTTQNLVLDNTAGASVSNAAGDSLIVTGVLTLTAGNLTTNGKLKLKATGAGAYGQIAGTGAGCTGGTMIAEYQVLSGGAGWRPVSSPLDSATLSQLEDDFPLNYGTPNWQYATIYTFNESRTPAWQVPLSTTSLNDSCFSIYMGPASWAGGIPAYMDITGTYRCTTNYSKSNMPLTGANSDTSGWHYMRNPWPSGFLWDGTISNVQGNQVYLYDQNGGSGGFYRVYDNTSQGVIPPFASLLFKVTANNVTVTLPNSKRTTDSLKNVFDKTFPLDNYVELGIQKEGQPVTDYVKFYTDPTAQNYFDEQDGVKKLNDPSMPSIYFATGLENLNKHAYHTLPVGTTKLPLLFQTTTNGKYIINPRIENLEPGVEVFIEDLNTGKREMYPINNSPIEINYTGNGVAARYYMVFVKKATNTGVEDAADTKTISIAQNDKVLYINGSLPAHTQLTITDILGRVMVQKTIDEATNGITQVDVQQLATGYYIVNLSSASVNHTQKIIVK